MGRRKEWRHGERKAWWEMHGREGRGKEENELAGKRRGVEHDQQPRARGTPRNNGRRVGGGKGRTSCSMKIYGKQNYLVHEGKGKPRKANVITFYGITIIFHCIIFLLFQPQTREREREGDREIE